MYRRVLELERRVAELEYLSSYPQSLIGPLLLHAQAMMTPADFQALIDLIPLSMPEVHRLVRASRQDKPN